MPVTITKADYCCAAECARNGKLGTIGFGSAIRGTIRVHQANYYREDKIPSNLDRRFRVESKASWELLRD